MKTFTEISQEIKIWMRLRDGRLSPTELGYRQLFLTNENRWLLACRNWIQEGHEEAPEQVYPDLHSLLRGLDAYYREVASLHLLCTQMAICAQRLCRKKGVDRRDAAGKLVDCAQEALGIPASDELVSYSVHLGESQAKDPPEFVVHKVLSYVGRDQQTMGKGERTIQAQACHPCWHLRQVSWLQDLVTYLLGQHQPGIAVRAPFVLVRENKASSMLAEFELEILAKGHGEAYIHPEQAFVRFEDGFDDVFDVALDIARRLVPNHSEESDKSDVRIRIYQHEETGDSSEQNQVARSLLELDVLRGRSAIASAALGIYHGLTRKVYDSRVIAIAEADTHGLLKQVSHVSTKVEKVILSGLFDTVVVVQTNIEEARKALDGSEGIQLRTASTLEDLVKVRSALTEEVLIYLKELAKTSAKLPKYYPEHLRNQTPNRMPFDELRKKRRVTTDRSRFDQRVAQEQEIRQGLDPDSIPYGPHRGARDEGDEQDLEPKVETLDWDEQTSRHFNRAVILGNPGFGKSWLLRYESGKLACKVINRLTTCTSDVDDIDLPVLMHLPDMASEDCALEDTIIVLLGEGYSINFRDYLRKQLTSSHGVLFLDAWDEVDLSSRRKLKDRIHRFASQYPTRILITSRVVGYDLTEPPLLDGKELELLAWNWRQIMLFVRVWFGSDGQKAKRFLKKLKSHESFRGLARIPLMLQLLCKAYPEGNLPARRSDLYSECLWGLLRDWQSRGEDHIARYNETQLNDMYISACIEVLEHLSLDLYEKGLQQFKEDDIRPVIDSFLRKLYEDDTKDWHELKKEHISPADLFKRFKDDGILISAKSVGRELRFLHLTFQEYLAARALAKRRDCINKALEHVYDPASHEVLSLLESQPCGAGLNNRPTRNYIARLLMENKKDFLCRPLLLAVEVVAEAPENRFSPTFLCGLRETIQFYFARIPHVLQFTHHLAGLLGEYLIEPCVVCLKSNERWMHRRAVEVLGKIGSPSAVGPLLDAMEDKDAEVRREAAMALGDIGSAEAVGRLAEALKDKDDRVRKAATEALCSIGSSGARSALTDALRGEDVLACQAALEALDTVCLPETVSVLANAIQEEYDGVRRTAVRTLVNIGSPEALRLLTDALKSKNPAVCIDAVQAIGDIGSPAAIKELECLLSHGESWIRAEAVRALGKIHSPKAFAVLTKTLYGKDLTNRSVAANVLGKIASPKSIAALTGIFGSDDDELRLAATRALAGSASIEANNALEVALDDRNDKVRALAAAVLGEKGSPKAIAFLLDTLKNGGNELRLRATDALGKIGSREAVEALIGAIGDTNDEVRTATVNALGKIGSPEAVEALIGTIGDANDEVRKATINALGKIGSCRALDALTKILDDEDTEIRRAAVEAIGKIGSPEAVDTLIRTCRHRSSEIRLASVNALALAKRYSPEVIEAVMNVMKDQHHPRIRLAAVEVLKKIASQDIVSVLMDVLDDESEKVRVAAVETLAIIGSTEATVALKRFLKDRNEWVRFTALGALCEISSDEATKVLKEILVTDGYSWAREKAAAALYRRSSENKKPVSAEGIISTESGHTLLLLNESLESLARLLKPQMI